jgi:phospholipase/lecithinase/hemolysin
MVGVRFGGMGSLFIIAILVSPGLATATEGRSKPTGEIILDQFMLESAEPLNATLLLSDLIIATNYTILIQLSAPRIDPADSGGGYTLASRWLNFTATSTTHSARIDWAARPAEPALQSVHAWFVEVGQQIVTPAGSARFISIPSVVLPQPSDFVLFGDSLSDQGNSYNVWNTPDSPPYWQGRFSDGKVWSEHVGSGLGIITNEGRGSSSGNNRAFGGADSGDGMKALVIPNSGKQIDDYTDNNNFNGDEIVSLWVGGNDYLNSGETDTGRVISNIESELQRLIADGADVLLVPELPPLERTPRSMEDDSSAERSALRDRVIEHNRLLDEMLNRTESTYGVTTVRLSIHSMYETIWFNPSLFDIVNVTGPACDHDGLLCSDGDPIAPNKHQYLFFDKIHPTARIHELISIFALASIGTPDTDGDGIADSEDGCPSTVWGTPVLSDGCDVPPPDADSDGVTDDNDDCPDTLAGAIIDAAGCSDIQRDTDNDGVVDAADTCPATPSNEVADLAGCSATQRDGDGDGVVDAYDSCPSSPIGELVASDGCALSEVDRDGDGVMDDADACLGTPADEPANSIGCGLSQLDDDGDGIYNLYDNCPFSSSTEIVDLQGCAASQRDSDSDLVVDSLDICPNTIEFSSVDDAGCSDQQRDLDDDGRLDFEDDCIDTSGSLRGCPILSIEARIIQSPTESKDAVVELLFECESNCSMLYTSSASNETSDVQPGMLELVIENPGPGLHVITFRISVNGTFAEDSVSLSWPTNQQVINQPDSAIENGSNDEMGVVIEEGSSFSSNLDPSGVGLFGLLILANLAVLMILIKKRRSRNSRRKIDSSPAALMDQTRLFR